mmetsp:Transcript_63391/g.105303  ORF Transcript_63391/g.105303 Transcript_63391/m.105303 type:complete len:323 (-) Transcript_63391:183-1151(-)
MGPTLLYVGDWGGESDSQPTTAAQITSATGMAKVAKELGAESILLLGDNFYLHGVPAIDSKRFEATFEHVYSTDLFGGLPFRVIAGNHDHLGNVSAQMQYSGRDSRWSFPSLYYNLHYNWTTISGGSRTAQIVMIDTPTLAGILHDFSGTPLHGLSETPDAAREWAWIEQQLSTSTADFLFVAGHYPIYSAGNDGTTRVLVEKLLPLLSRYGAHYICGHDHLAQHIISDGVHQFQNGMGMECCYGLNNIHTVPAGQVQYVISGKHALGQHIGRKPPLVKGGFNSIAFEDDVAKIVYYKEDGVAIYTPPALPPRDLESLEITV